jgi:enamine deaminase RidA (YjgF/YER057c/UK114 family)
VSPHQRDAVSVRDVRAVPSCPCDACARSGARLARLGEQTTLESSNLYGTGADAYEQVWNMFCAAERLLQQCGMDFRAVSRTWIHLRDIDRDYDALNRARREFFRQRGIELRPASTAVQGAPFTGAHDFSLRVRAVQSSPPITITRMSTPSLNEAWSYGADFSRGLRLAEANKVALHISGTASLDETGRTVHVGDFAAQAERMLDNIELLLARQGASYKDLVSGVAYLKRPDDAAALRAKFMQRGFADFPCPIVDAPLCRPELLCEVEAVALLPFNHAGV